MKALIVYASMTGNTEEIARFLSICLKGMEIEPMVKECQQISASAFQKSDICIVATYTYGSAGDLPDEIVPFYEELAQQRLEGKIYGTLGSGEEDYGYFCKSADDFALQFKKTGAKLGAPTIKIEEQLNWKGKQEIAHFAETIVKSASK